MNKSTLFFEFENGKVVLPIDIKTDLSQTQKMVNEFEAIDMGPIKKFISYNKTQYTTAQFHKFLRSKLLTQDQRDILDLRERIEKLEEVVLSGKIKIKKDPTRAQEAIRNFHARIKDGEEKANKINKIIEISGLKIAPLSASGYTSYGSGDVGEVRCVVYIEDLYDELGEDKFTEIVTALATVGDVRPKQLYFMALRYAIETKKMTGLNAAIAAEIYFKEDYSKLTEHLRALLNEIKEKTDSKPINLGIVLGKILTGELKYNA
jgi:hypothetical protein